MALPLRHLRLPPPLRGDDRGREEDLPPRGAVQDLGLRRGPPRRSISDHHHRLLCPMDAGQLLPRRRRLRVPDIRSPLRPSPTILALAHFVVILPWSKNMHIIAAPMTILPTEEVEYYGRGGPREQATGIQASPSANFLD